MSARTALSLLAPLALLAGCATPAPAPLADATAAQQTWAASCEDFDEWDKPGPAFRIYGNSYYVGTCGISAILVARADGHVLIDSGTDEGAKVVLANIAALGFDPADIDTILMSHEHFDHVGGLARIQAATGATIVATPEAAAVLRAGVPSEDDPQHLVGHPPFPVVTGAIATNLPAAAPAGFTVIMTPGHTPGATSWRWQECEGGECRWLVYADSMNPIGADAYRFSDHPALLAAFRQGIADMKATPCDIVLAPHPGAANLRARLAGSAPLHDPDGCRAYAAGVEARLDAKLAEEAGG